eukprot:TRINITY_DN1887_c0_g1_i2.p1 TRINITY_DN1887_c0_g1~~TRINITY_DN1887_c0_g1_i2.p1  ORF type:complete len:247 (+),score=41.37 TRINITY_DN1887_c0_g1_i2:106-846(+)
MADVAEADKREAKSLAEVLADEDLALLFRDFLHHLHSAENLAFWLEIEEFKLIERSAERRERAEQICTKYLDSRCDAPVRFSFLQTNFSEMNPFHEYNGIPVIDVFRNWSFGAVFYFGSARNKNFFIHVPSRVQVNVDAVLKDSVREQIESGGKIRADIFDEMQDFIYGMMEFDSFRKFLASDQYKKWQSAEGAKKPKKTGLFSRLMGAPRRKKSGSVGPADGPPAGPVRTDSLLMLQNHIKNNKK